MIVSFLFLLSFSPFSLLFSPPFLSFYCSFFFRFYFLFFANLYTFLFSLYPSLHLLFFVPPPVLSSRFHFLSAVTFLPLLLSSRSSTFQLSLFLFSSSSHHSLRPISSPRFLSRFIYYCFLLFLFVPLSHFSSSSFLSPNKSFPFLSPA